MPRDIIMAPLDGGPGDQRVLEAAAACAGKMDAAVDAVFLGRDDAAALMVAGDGFTGLGAAALQSLREDRAKSEEQARTAASAKPRVSYRVYSGPRAHASSMARLAAFAVIDAAAARGEGPLADIFQALLFEDGAPILIPRTPGAPRRAVLAWDGSREAARALRISWPLISFMGELVVLQSASGLDDKDIGCIDPRHAVEWVERHGGAARAVKAQGAGSPGAMLLDAAAAHDADLIIAGAYGHTRLREIVFGGVTRTLINCDGPSLFLAH